jgi:hypothetical protein
MPEQSQNVLCLAPNFFEDLKSVVSCTTEKLWNLPLLSKGKMCYNATIQVYVQGQLSRAACNLGNLERCNTYGK